MFERKDKAWMAKYRQLIEYKERFGDCKVPSGWKENRSLAKWVTHQREDEGTMLPERKELLDKIGFLWSEDIQKMKEASWMNFYEQLKAYYSSYGCSKVPETSAKYRSLSLWESRQRKRKDKLKNDQVDLLNEIGFLWKEDLARQEKEAWMAKYEQLQEYFNEHGHSKVPFHSKDKDLSSLGSFVSRLRRNRGRLENWQLKLLDKVDFVWSSEIQKDNRKQWLIMLNLLKKFKKEYGHCDVPSKYDQNPPLGRWVETQRKEFSKLDDWKQKKLLDLGFNTSAMLRRKEWQKWKAMYQKLVEFYEKYGHSDVPENWEEDPELARFVVNQRWAKKPAKDKIELLQRVDFHFKGELTVERRKRDHHGRFVTTLE